METKAYLAIAVFTVTYIAILSEKVHKTIAALLGASAMLLLGLVSQEEALQAVDLNVIFLLMGMMVITHYLAESGFFGYIAVRLAQFAKGKPVPLMIWLCVATGVLSAMIDNVTTVLLVAPVTFLIARELEINPIPFLLFEVMAANIGGTATLIGDPPNILIGSRAGLPFNAFIIHLAPIAIICLVGLLGAAALAVGRLGRVPRELRLRVMEMRPEKAISDRKLLIKSGVVLGVVLVSFALHSITHIEPTTAALAGAALLILITDGNPHKSLQAVEWPTLFFFVGLFILVWGLESNGVLEWAAHGAMDLTQGDLLLTMIVIIWFAGILSAFVDNIPLVATLIPILQTMIPEMAASTDYDQQTVSHVLWWSLALGGCFGGNGTIFGAAANVVVVEIAARNGQPITFRRFILLGMPVTIVTLMMATAYMWIRYLL